MASYNTMRIELLNKDNYDTWKIQMEALLTKNRTWAHVNGTLRKPALVVGDGAAASTEAIQAWELKDQDAKSDILLSISPSELKRVKGCVTSNEVWLKLESIYQSDGPARMATLLKQLFLHRMEESEDVREHLRKFFDTVDKLSEMEIDINPKLLAVMLMYSLPKSFENFRCAVETRDTLPTPEALRVKIVEESDARKRDEREPDTNAMLARKQNAKRYNNSKKNRGGGSGQNSDGTFKYRCHRCHQQGHKAADCKGGTKAPDDGKRVEHAKQAENLSMYVSPEEALKSSNANRPENWCLDSGCTSHLCKDEEKFVEIEESRPGKLNLASHASAEIKGRGTVEITAEVDGQRKNVSLKDTLHVPDLRMNLLSVGKMTDNGFTVVFGKRSAEVIDGKGRTVLVATRMNGLYYLQDEAHECNSITESKYATVESWHRRMGHLNVGDLLESERNGTVLGMNLNGSREKFDCETCIRGKMTRAPFPNTSDRSTDILEIIHSDVCGPMRVESNGRARYFITFIDDCTRWCEIKMLKKKSEALDAFKEFKNYVETQTERKIKCLQSDNGTEYLNKGFDEYLSESGIGRRLTVTHTPEQNGVAERKNRTLVEMARCLLIQSGLPSSFWGEAINTANYIRNRCPSRSIEGGTPFEKWTGKAPDVSDFREFGSEVFTLDREPSKGKFQPRSKKGIFVGYSEQSKAYRVWVPEDRKIDITRDVKFTGIKPTPSDKPYEEFEPEEMSLPIRNYVEFPIEAEVQDEQEGRNDLENNELVDEENQDGEEQGLEEENDNAAGNGQRRGRGRPRREMTGRRGRPRKIYQPANYAEEDSEVAYQAEIPFQEAIDGSNADEWRQAIAAELKSIIKKDTWTVVERPPDRKVIGSRVVLRNKYDQDGNIDRRKARIVARGFAQRPGVDFDETFAPVARLNSIRMMMALATQYGMKVNQFDVTTAYLNGVLEEKIYMELPKLTEETLEEISHTESRNSEIGKKARKMLRDLEEGDKVCLLHKALYGLRQAGRRWHAALSEQLENSGLTQSTADPCTFFSGQGEDILIVTVYVDDMLVASRNEAKIIGVLNHLSKKFEVKNLGEIKYCLGIEFTRDDEGITMNQKGYVNDILDRFGMLEAKPVATPLDLGTKLTRNEEHPGAEEENLPYRELVGALMYLAVCSRPDLAYAVSYLSQYSTCYNKTHWVAAKRVLRYLKGTADVGLRFLKSTESLTGFVDADWANCLDDRRSYTGYAFILGGGPISWESRKQRTVALSSTEAEYMALTEATKEAMYLRQFLIELGFENLANVRVFNDNNGALKLSENPVFHQRTKHINVRHHFVRDVVKSGLLKVEHISTDDMAADVLTKGLSGPKHVKCLKKLGMEGIRSHLEGKCWN